MEAAFSVVPELHTLPMPRHPFVSKQTVLYTVLLLWAVGLATGAAALWRYSSTPGTSGNSALDWPDNALIPRPSGRSAVVMAAHPRCPCTRASLNEFARLMARGEADGWVIFLRPEGTAQDWEKTSLWQKAAAIPQVRVVADENGRLAKAFGAETSGHVLFYDGNARLHFSGGITSMRGHEGHSVGGDAILAQFLGRQSTQDRAPTFGCPLHERKELP